MGKLNSGLLFQRNYESASCAVRRFLLANEGLGKSDYKKISGNSATRDAFISLVISAQSNTYWKENAWLGRRSWGSLSADPVMMGEFSPISAKQCPECAKEVFHSHLYSFAWVKRCPIHNTELTEVCPDCGRQWPEYKGFEEIDCPTCGTIRPSSSSERKKQTRGHTHKEIEHLGLFWSFTSLGQYFLDVLYYDYPSHGVESGILYGSFAFPELAVTFYPEYTYLYEMVGAPCPSLEQLKFGATPLSGEYLRSVKANVSEDYSRYQNVIASASEEIEYAISEHADILYGTLTKTPAEVDFLIDYDAKKVALDVWRSVCVQQKEVDSNGTWWHRIFELLRVPLPELSPVAHLVLSSDHMIIAEPDSEFKKWLLKIHLLNLYIYIYKHILLLQLLMATDNPVAAINSQKQWSVIWHPKYNNFRVKYCLDGGLQVVFRPLPTWSEIFSNERLVRTNVVLYQPMSWQDTFSRYLMSEQSGSLDDALTFARDYNFDKWGAIPEPSWSREASDL